MSNLPDRTPLNSLSPGDRAALLKQLQLGEDLLPLSLTPEERHAALLPAKPIPLTAEERQRALKDGYYNEQRPKMEPKPGWKTSELWLHVLVTLVVLPVLGYFGNQAISPLGTMMDALGGLNPLLGLAVPILKTALFGLLAWVAGKLAKAYGDNRAEVKVAALGAAGDGAAKA